VDSAQRGLPCSVTIGVSTVTFNRQSAPTVPPLVVKPDDPQAHQMAAESLSAACVTEALRRAIAEEFPDLTSRLYSMGDEDLREMVRKVFAD